MLQFDSYTTLVCATLVLLLGRLLVNRVKFLHTFNIPKPVAGGLVIALLLWFFRSTLDIKIQFDTNLQTPLMLAFFASIGLSADLASLSRGGKKLFTFLFVVTGLLLVQNSLGVGLAMLLGLDPLIGLLAGSITLSGGHGTGAAWSGIFSERFGIHSAAELAIACATFGLVLGGLIGGPVARHLVKRVSIPGTIHNQNDVQQPFEMPDMGRPITPFSLIEVVALIAISLTGGELLANYLTEGSFALPQFVCVLFVGVILRNILTLLNWHEVSDREVSLLGNVSLSLFLAMALMTLKLWDLASLAIPMFIILTCQAIVMALYAVFITFPVMGRDYDSVVLSAGHCGFGLGATPTAIANMQAVTHCFGPSHLAFLLVPMVGAFFLDIINAIVIKLFLIII